MNLNLVGVVLLMGGVVMLYSSVKNKNPIQVLKDSLAAKSNPGGGVEPALANYAIHRYENRSGM